jgi:hypothetical protein
MLGKENTAGSVNKTDAERRAMAAASLTWNFSKFDKFEPLFKTYFEVIGINPATKKRQDIIKEEKKEE